MAGGKRTGAGSGDESQGAHVLNGRRAATIVLVALLIAAAGLSAAEELPQDIAVLDDLAALHFARGDYIRARKFFVQAVESRQASLGPDDPELADPLDRLGSYFLTIGDNERAEPPLRRALELRRAMYEGEHIDIAASSHKLGRLLMRLEHFDDARERFAEALEIARNKLGGDHYRTAFYAADLAAALVDLERHDEAGPLLTAAMESIDRTLGPYHPAYADALATEGLRLSSLGQLKEARQRLIDATGIRLQLLGPRHPDVAEAMLATASVQWKLGQAGIAFDNALRAEEIARHHFSTIMQLPSGQTPAAWFGEIHSRAIDLVVAALAGQPKIREDSGVERLWDAIVRSRTLVLDERAERGQLVPRHDVPGEAERIEAVNRTRRVYAHATIVGPDPLTPGGYAEQIARLYSEKEAAERELSAAHAWREIGWEQVDAALPEGASLVSYLRFHPPGSSDPTSRRYAALVRTPQTIAFLDLAGSTEIERLVRRWRSQDAEAGAELRRRIWEKIVPTLPAEGAIFVVREGAVEQIRLALLPQAQDPPAVEVDARIQYLSKERNLVRAKVSAPPAD